MDNRSPYEITLRVVFLDKVLPLDDHENLEKYLEIANKRIHTIRKTIITTDVLKSLVLNLLFIVEFLTHFYMCGKNTILP